MGRKLLALTVVLVAGCDKLLSLTDITPLADARVDGPPDAPTDAMPFACPQHEPVFWCADFDETTAITYGDGSAITVPLAPPGVTAMQQSPGVSAPNALMIDTTTDPNNNRYDCSYTGQTAVTRLRADFDLDIEKFATTNATEIAQIGIDAAPNHCYVQLQLGNTMVMNVRSDCGGVASQPALLFGGIPAGWKHYELDIDVQAGTASASYERTSPTDLTLPTKISNGGTGFGDVGVFFVGGGVGPQLAFDNVLVTAQ